MGEALGPAERIRRILAKEVAGDPVFASYSLPVLRRGEEQQRASEAQQKRRERPRLQLRCAAANDPALERRIRDSALSHLVHFLKKNRPRAPEPSEKKLARLEKKRTVVRKKSKFLRRKRQQTRFMEN